MDTYKHSHPLGSGEHQDTKKDYADHSKIAHFIERIHTRKMLHLITGLCQLLFGITVIISSVLALIRPFWLSVALTGLGSVSVTSGIYFCYASFSKLNGNTLLRDAMRRIVEDQN